MCVGVEPGMRAAAAVAWEPAAKTSLLVLALSLLDKGCCSSVYCSSTGCCSNTCCCCCCCCCGRCSSRGGGGPLETIRPSRWWSRFVLIVGAGYVCLMGRKYLSHGIQTGKNNEKQRKMNNERKKNTSAYAHVPFSTGQHMGRPMGRPVKPWAGPSNPRAGPRNSLAGPYRARVSWTSLPCDGPGRVENF